MRLGGNLVMRKILSYILVALFIVMTLASCADENSTTTNTSTDNVSTDTETNAAETSKNETSSGTDTPAGERKTGLLFASVGDGTCYVVGRDETKATELFVPEKIKVGEKTENGEKVPITETVIGIAANAFENATDIKNIEFEVTSQLTIIESAAFSGCTNLK